MKVLWLLLMVCGAAQAQEWIELTRTSNATVMVQTGGATRAPSGKPAVWVYLDYARPEPNGAMSTRAFIEADCAGMQTRMLAVTDHSLHRGGGSVVATSRPKDWEPVAPSTVTARAWMYACTGK